MNKFPAEDKITTVETIEREHGCLGSIIYRKGLQEELVAREIRKIHYFVFLYLLYCPFCESQPLFCFFSVFLFCKRKVENIIMRPFVQGALRKSGKKPRIPVRDRGPGLLFSEIAEIKGRGS